MAQDDVTKGKPLTGGRQRANQIIVHRIEAGLWERKNILEPVAASAKAINEVRAAASVAIPIVLAGGVYVAWKAGKSVYNWTDGVLDDLEGFKKAAAPIQNQAAFVAGEEDAPVMGLTESVVLTVLNFLGFGK